MTGTTQQSAEQAARALFATDTASQSLRMELLGVGPGAASVSMTVLPSMANGHGICHGGYLFMLADSAFAFACNSHGEPAVAASAAIDFLAPVRIGDRLTAAAQEKWLGGRTGIYDIAVSRADGTVVAHFRGRSHRIVRTPGSVP